MSTKAGYKTSRISEEETIRSETERLTTYHAREATSTRRPDPKPTK